MLGNVALDSLLGAIPVAGDVFDFAWKSNARNVRLLERHVAAPVETRRASTTLVVLAIAAALLVVVGSVVGIVWLFGRLRG
jgi:hypothetical protein